MERSLERNRIIRLTGNGMTWVTHLGNKRPIESLYSKSPSLSEVRLHEVRLHQDGPRVSLRFDLNEFPDTPPRKWITGKFNRAQMTLVLVDIHDFQMNGWGLNNIGDLTLEEHGSGVCLRFVGQSARVDCYAQFVEVEKLSGYHDSTRSTDS